MYEEITQQSGRVLQRYHISIDLQLNCSISDCVYWVTNEKTDCA